MERREKRETTGLLRACVLGRVCRAGGEPHVQLGGELNPGSRCSSETCNQW
jgi:hypothetical protein